MSEVPDTGVEASERPARSLSRLLLWSSVDLDTRGLSPDVLGIASGVAFAAAMAVLYLVGEGWTSMRTVQLFTIGAGLAVGVAGTYDVLSKRPVQLLVPMAQLLAVVLLITLVLRFSGYKAASRAALAWSLGLHLCLLPLTTRLWAIFFGERASGRDVARRRRLLGQAERGDEDTLLVRVLDSNPGFTEAKPIGPRGDGILRLATNLLSPRPRPGLVYVLSKAVVVNKTVPGSEERGEWARYVVGADESVMLGQRATVIEPAESAMLATRAMIAIVLISVALTGLATIAAL